jgi:hypothetical protein
MRINLKLSRAEKSKLIYDFNVYIKQHPNEQNDKKILFMAILGSLSNTLHELSNTINLMDANDSDQIKIMFDEK